MSFSAEVKRELCRLNISKKCCAQAEAYGILLYCNTFNSRAFRKAFRVQFDEVPEQEEGKGTFLIRDPEKLRRIFETFGHEMDSAPSIHVNFAVLEEDHCRTAFFRGAFLAGGSVTDPEKSYNLEFLSTRHYLSQQLEAMLAEHDFNPHRALRKGANTVYIKSADHIEDLLTFMGAGNAAMRIMDQRMYNDMRNKTNRLSNCETANLGKSVQAAVQVQLAIEKLQAAGAMSTLPENLRLTAKLRMQYPDLPLAKLAQKFDPPVSKAGLSHRLKRIQEAARRLDETAESEKPTRAESTKET